MDVKAKFDDAALRRILRNDRSLGATLVEHAEERLPAIEAELATRARVKNGMQLLTVDNRRLKGTQVATIHAYGPIGEKLAKKHGIRWNR